MSSAKKAEGGYTDVSSLAEGYVSRATLYQMGSRRYIAGEAGREFILNNQSLRYPVVARFADMLDAIQKSKSYSALDQLGGGTAASRFSLGAAPGQGTDLSALIESNQEVSRQIQLMNATVTSTLKDLDQSIAQSGNRPVVFNTKTFDKHRDFVFKIENDVNV